MLSNVERVARRHNDFLFRLLLLLVVADAVVLVLVFPLYCVRWMCFVVSIGSVSRFIILHEHKWVQLCHFMVKRTFEKCWTVEFGKNGTATMYHSKSSRMLLFAMHFIPQEQRWTQWMGLLQQRTYNGTWPNWILPVISFLGRRKFQHVCVCVCVIRQHKFVSMLV